jgi:hypothetical protein
MLKQPKSIAEWRKERLRKAKQEGGFILIPMELWNGEAFHVLEKAEKLILLECLSQLAFRISRAYLRAIKRCQPADMTRLVRR